MTFYLLGLVDKQSVGLYLSSPTKNSKGPFGDVIEGLSEIDDYSKWISLPILIMS